MADNLRDKANARYTEARDKVGDTYAQSRKKAEDALSKGKVKANDAVAATKASATKAARQTVEGVEKNPIVALVGGLAIGAIAAALLPRTQREDSLMGNMGAKVRQTASDAAKAARTAGKEQLDTLGVSTDAAKEQFRELASKIGKAATSASSAAADSVRKR
jgi:ElaB/YqjD/DUF883 family membrane-anchored ribosome-binding protein